MWGGRGSLRLDVDDDEAENSHNKNQEKREFEYLGIWMEMMHSSS